MVFKYFLASIFFYLGFLLASLLLGSNNKILQDCNKKIEIITVEQYQEEISKNDGNQTQH